MKSNLLFFIAVVILCVVDLRPASAQKDKPKVRIGVITVLSGPLSTYGEAVQNGFLLANEELAKSSMNYDIVFEDSKYEGKTALSSLQKLISADDVRLVFSWGCGPSEALAPVAERVGIPLFSTCPDEAHSENRKFVFRFRPPGSAYAEVLTEFIEERKFKSLAVIAVENPYFNSILSSLRLRVKEEVNLHTVDTFSPGFVDFKSTITRIRDSKYDAALVFLLPGQVAQFHIQADQLGLDMPFIGSEVHESQEEAKLARGHLDGVVLPTTIVSDEFREKYVGRFQSEVRIQLAATAYDFAKLVGREFKNDTNEVSRAEVAARLRASSPFTGACGEVRFTTTKSKSNGFSFPVVLKKFEGGKAVLYREAVR